MTTNLSPSPTHRPRRLALLAVGALAAVGLVACGDDDARGADAPSSGAPPDNGVVVRLETGGGFVPREVAFSAVPTLVITGDGVAITGAATIAIYPGPLLPPLVRQQLDPDGLEAVVEEVRSSGLLDGEVDFGQPNIADVGTTTLTVTVDGTTTTLAAVGLREVLLDDPSLTAAQRQAREDLLALTDRLSDLAGVAGAAHLGPAEPFVPAGIWVEATVAPDIDADGAPVTQAGSDEADDEADERGEPVPTLVPWTVETVELSTLDEQTLLVGADGQAAYEALAEANSLTRFTQAGVAYQVLGRPALPGDA